MINSEQHVPDKSNKYKHMKFSKYLILFFSIPLFAFTLHKYYISLCEIEYVEEQKSIQIIIGLFIDDIELTLNKEHKTKFYLASENEVENIDDYYKKYLKDHLKFIINETPESFQFIGKEYDDDIVRFYLEISDINKLSSIEIMNTCLFKDFNDQQNIIKIKVNNLHKSFYLNKKNANCLLKI